MKRLCLVIVASLATFVSYSQVVHVPNSNMEEWFKADVTTMSEFRERFNKCVNTEISYSLDERRKGLLSLFNRSSEAVMAKQDTVQRFVNEILDKKPVLSFTDSLWYAEVLCAVKYKGKQHDIRLLLKTEFVDTDLYRWAFIGANGLREAGILKDTAYGFIEPVDNELNFIGMESRLEQDYKNALGYKSSVARISQLSVFLYLLQDHQVTIEFVDKIKYHFLNIPGYVFIVEHNTKPMNSGWLISDITMISDNGKELYEKALFGDY